jgi:hypothetical protein
MPELPISFTKGINRLNGAPADSIYDIANAYLDAYDEIKAWRRGDTEDSTWLPNAKPWVKFSERWFDSRYMDDYLIYRNRLYLTQVVEGDNGIQNRTLQVVDFVDTDSVLEDNQLNALAPLTAFGSDTFVGAETGRTITQQGNIVSGGLKRSWGADDPGIIGITLGRAVDYIFIPLDKFGQAGPWVHMTIFADLDTSGAENISGTDVYTITPSFTFGSFVVWGSETVRDYERILVYRTIEYDLGGITVDSSYAGEAENIAIGGFYFEDATTDSGYTSEAYWPFNIQREDSGRSDQVGPLLDRSRNMWSNSLGFNRQLGAKTAHIDGGVAIYGNVNFPTKIVSVVHRQAGRRSVGTYSMVNGSPDTITRASGDFTTDGILIGDTIVVNGFATQANNRKFTVVNVTSTTITLDTTTTVTAEAGVTTAVITTAPNFVFQYRYQTEDGTNAYGQEQGGFLEFSRNQRSIVPWLGESGLVVYVKHEVSITGIDDSPNTISIQGDWVSFFTSNLAADRIAVTGTASNNASFTPTGGATYSAGSTIIPVLEDITVAEGAGGTLTFFVVWEKMTPDFNGRYVSDYNVNGELYTATHGEKDWEDKSSYVHAGIYDAVFEQSQFIREKSVAYMSQVNAPWEITINGFRIPDSSEILAITPSRLEEIEQISSYSFYVFTKNGIFAAIRDGYDVLLTAVESVMGIKVFSGYPLIEVVKGGVVFFGTDDNLYFMTGRQVQRLDYVVSDLFGTIVDMAFDPVEEYLYVYSDTGIWIYDFIRQIWIGQYTIGQDVNDYDIQFEFSGDVYTGDVAADPFGSSIVLTDDIVFDEDNFRIFSEQSPRSIGLILDFYVDRDVAATTDLIATAEIADAGTDWNITAGDILSGDVTVLAGDTIRMEINDPGTPLFVGDLGLGTGIVKVKGGVGAGDVTLNLGSLGFDPQFKKMLFRYTVSGGLVIEDMNQTGDVMPCEVHTQEIGGVAVQKNDYIKIDFDGVEHTGVGSGTSGTNVVTIASGDVPGHTRDKMGMIVIPQGGIDNYGTQTRLITTISSVGSVGDISLADNLRNAVTSQTIDWRSPALLTLFLLDSGTFRDRELGTYRIVPNKKYYLPGRPRRFQLKIENFDVVREILIFLTNSIEQD